MPKAEVPPAFREVLAGLVRRVGTHDALGKKIGMSGSRVGRAIRGDYSFNIKNCLKLADACGESPSHILRVAGKADIAELIERLYGQSRPLVSPNERELLENWNAVSQRLREYLRGIMREFLGRGGPKPPHSVRSPLDSPVAVSAAREWAQKKPKREK